MEMGALPSLQCMDLRKWTEPNATWTWAFWNPFPRLTWLFPSLGPSDQHPQPLCLLWQWALSDEQVQPWREAEDNPPAVLSLHSSFLVLAGKSVHAHCTPCFKDTKPNCGGQRVVGPGLAVELSGFPRLLGLGCGWERCCLFLRLLFCFSHHHGWARFANVSFQLPSNPPFMGGLPPLHSGLSLVCLRYSLLGD